MCIIMPAYGEISTDTLYGPALFSDGGFGSNIYANCAACTTSAATGGSGGPRPGACSASDPRHPQPERSA